MRATFFILWLTFAFPLWAQEPKTAQPEQPSNQATLWMIEGMTRAFQRDYVEAIAAYEKALVAAPAQAAILFALAEAHYENGNPQSALFFAQQAVQNKPENREYLGFLAQITDRQGDTARATQLWQQFANDHPTDLQSLLLLSSFQLKSGNTRGAIETFKRLKALRPDNLLYTLTLADLYERTSNFQDVSELLQPVVFMDPYDKSSLRKLITAYERLQRKSDMVSVLQDVVAQDPYDVASRLKLKELVGTSGTDNRASAEVQVAPLGNAWTLEHAKAFFAQIHTDPTALSQAEQALKGVTSEQPNLAEAWILLGKVRFQQARYEEAAQILGMWLSKYPRDLEGWALAIQSSTLAGDTNKALRLAQEAGFLFPGQPRLLHSQAEAYIASAKFREAQNILTEAAAIIKSDFGDAVSLQIAQLDKEGELLKKQGNLLEARKRWQAALILDPNQATIRAKLEFQNQ
ncbi:MAG: tetratricopeptide repeat protein [Bacteroidetes Order II. Incertae sedis bacterium]|nr:tetratricopeptide repeat protein [Bacteroidetes Order II. bacterium]